MKKYNLVVTGHGHFATGMQSAIELLAGKQENIRYVNFSEDIDEKVLHQNLEKALSENNPTVVFTDLVGGTPYKEAAKIAFDSKNVYVVAGCNLASILETIYKEYDSIESYVDDLVNISKLGTQKLDLSNLEVDSTLNSSDGI